MTINVPPFPPLTADEFFWVGEIIIPFWIGYEGWKPMALSAWDLNQKAMLKRGITREDWIARCTGPADGKFSVSVKPPEGKKPGRNFKPTQAQAKAFQHFLDKQDSISKAALKAIDKYVTKEQDEWWMEIFDDDTEINDQLSGLKGLDQYRRLLEPNIIHVLANEKDGVAYLGFEFECGWDEEHGCGVMTHKGKILAVGHGDDGFEFREPEE